MLGQVKPEKKIPFEAPPRALVADDHWYTYNAIDHTLTKAGYDVVIADNGKDAADLLLDGAPFDVVILDVVMPELDGFEVLRRARRAGVRAPIIMVSAMGTESDRVRGLDLGADDYLPKPFSSRELLARANAVRRRGGGTRPRPKKIRVGEVVVDFEKYVAYRREEPMHFTPLEWAVLRHLAHRQGKAVSRAEFNVKVLKVPASIETRTIDRHTYSLRCKLDEDPKKPRHVLSVTGVGYRLAEFELLA